MLWIDDSPQASREVRALLASVESGDRVVVEHVERLEVARARLGQDPRPDVVLLRLAGTGTSASVLPVVELRAAAPGLPAVVLASAADEPLAVKALQLGATDYLLVERLHGTLLVRCLLHAVETQRVDAGLAAGEDEDRLAFTRERAGESAAALLRQALPAAFEEMVLDYRGILDASVDQLFYRVDHGVEGRIRLLARRAGELGAGPRDLVELHAAAVGAALAEQGPQRAKLYRSEGRLRLLQLMGHLTSYYRDLSLASRRHHR